MAQAKLLLVRSLPPAPVRGRLRAPAVVIVPTLNGSVAQMARTILKTRDQLHQLAGELASQAVRVAGVRGAALDFTRELVRRIPIGPVDARPRSE